MNSKTNGRVLIIAGSDSGGGAGVQADIKSVAAQGAYATTAITALTAQNTQGVRGVFDVAPAFVAAQIEAVLGDIGADIIKTGMLARREVVEAVAQSIASTGAGIPTIVDPVMVASSGDVLLAPAAVDALQTLLLRGAYLATPNLPEASLLTKRDVETLDDMRRAADTLMDAGANAVLIKGGHAKDKLVQDLLAMQSGQHVLEHERLASANTHGTGCSLASALAANLALVVGEGSGRALTDEKLLEATQKSLDYIHRAIKHANPSLGQGNNKPLNHFPAQ